MEKNMRSLLQLNFDDKIVTCIEDEQLMKFLK
jgi:hypothetical protein